MKCIANIITDGFFENNGLYNVIKDKEALIKGIPTLVIGWTKTKALYPNANIIEWKISDNLYWTWGNRERRDRHEMDIERFKNIAIKQFIKPIKYTFLSVLTASDNTFNKFMSSISNEQKKTIYIENDMVYICYNGNPNIIGTYLLDFDYIGYDKKLFFSKMFANHNNIIIKNGQDIPFKLKILFKNNLYVIPYLFFC